MKYIYLYFQVKLWYNRKSYKNRRKKLVEHKDITYKESYEELKKDLGNKIVMLDGAMGTMLQAENLT